MSLHPYETVFEIDGASNNVLGFPDYVPALAVKGGIARVGDHRYLAIDFLYEINGGGMGPAEGAAIKEFCKIAKQKRLPVVLTVRTGGAKMQEGVPGLVQMPEVNAALHDVRREGIPVVAVCLDPAFGGVFLAAVYAASVRVAVEGAEMGFAGGVVVGAALALEAREKLKVSDPDAWVALPPQLTKEEIKAHRPDRSEFAPERLLKKGMINAIVSEDALAAWVESFLGWRDTTLVRPWPANAPHWDTPPATGAELVSRATNPLRPTGIDYAAALATSWTSLGSPDPTIETAIATIRGTRCIVIACNRRAGLARPRGLFAATRAMDLADEMGLPVVTFVDLSGDYSPKRSKMPYAVEQVMNRMRTLKVRSVSASIGEGGSGVALALSNADCVFGLKGESVEFVIHTELGQAILQRTLKPGQKMSELQKLDAESALKHGWIDFYADPEVQSVGDAIEAGFSWPSTAADRYQLATANALTPGGLTVSF